MEAISRIILDLSRPNISKVIYAKQWDKLSRYIECALYNGSTALTPPTGATFEVRGLKPDNSVLKYSVDESGDPAVSVTGNVATITLAQQALSVPGDVKMELAIKSGGEILTSLRFILRVEQSALAGATSTNYVNPALTTFIPSVSENGVISWENDGGLDNPTPRSIRGPSGAEIVSTVLIGTDPNGGNIYRQTFDNGETAVFTAPRGPAGAGNVSSVSGIEPDEDGDVPLSVGTSLLDNGAVTRAKLANDALYSPIIEVTASRNIALTDLGNQLKARASGAIVLTLPATVFNSMPTGFEFAVLWYSAASVSVKLTGDIYFADEENGTFTKNGTATLNGRFAMAAFKKVASDTLLMTGSAEVSA